LPGNNSERSKAQEVGRRKKATERESLLKTEYGKKKEKGKEAGGGLNFEYVDQQAGI